MPLLSISVSAILFLCQSLKGILCLIVAQFHGEYSQDVVSVQRLIVRVNGLARDMSIVPLSVQWQVDRKSAYRGWSTLNRMRSSKSYVPIVLSVCVFIVLDCTQSWTIYTYTLT